MSAVMLSVIMPVYNEARTISEMVARVRRAPIDLTRELIVVDDASTDATREALQKITADHGDEVRVFTHETNRGKGAAIRTGIAHARGDIVLIQDADLEYDPRDYPLLLGMLLLGTVLTILGTLMADIGYGLVDPRVRYS